MAEHHLSSHSALYASFAGVAVAGPLLGMMGFTLLASATLLVVTSPLLLLVSPVLLLAGFILAASLAGFGLAGAMALSGVWTLKWVVSAVQVLLRGRRAAGFGEWVENLVTGSGHRVKEWDVDLGGYSHRKLQVFPAGENGEIQVQRK